MMYSLKEQHQSLCVLRVSTDVLDLPGVVVTDRNAASDYVRFGPAPAALALVDRELVFARYWTHGDLIEQSCRKSIKCAEILVPDRVDAMHVSGA
jgi:ssDNA thymidine ADP-ribosyltransferase, DarT